MRKVFFVPKSLNYQDYESEWKGITGIVQHGLSENIKDYVEDENKAQMVLIPEYYAILAPTHTSNADFFQIEYFDDFEVLKREYAEITCEVWKKNLDNPSLGEEMVQNLPMNFEVGRQIWITNHIKLDIGWYDFVIKKDGVEVDTKECSIYEFNFEEE